MDLIERAIDFEQNEPRPKTNSERIVFSRKARELILAVNEIYKTNQDQELMDLMKKLTERKKKADKRLKG